MKLETKPTRMIIEELAKEYLADSSYRHSFITKEWIEKVSNTLRLKDLNDLELSNMYDMVDLTLKNQYYYLKDYIEEAWAYLDVKSAFLEVVNMEARRRREEKKEREMNKMKVVVLSNGELKEKEIENTLESLQKIVGGYIEIPFLSKKFFEHDIDIIINEEGKMIDGMEPEIAVIKRGTNQVLDIVYGNCIFASHDEEGNTTSLNDEQIEIVLKELQNEAMFSNGKMTKALFI